MSADDEPNSSSTPTKPEHIPNDPNGQLSMQRNNLSQLESPLDAKIRRRRNIHNNTIDAQTTSTSNVVPSTKIKRNDDHIKKSSAKKAKHRKRKSSSSSSDDDENNGHTFFIFSTIMSHKQHLTYGAIAIGLAVSLYPFLKYQFGFVDQSRKAVGSSATQPPRRSDGVKSALKDAPPDLDHQHINDMMGPHMQHRGPPAMRGDKGGGKSESGRSSSKRGGSFGLGSLLGGGMGSLYSAGAIMFALYSFGKVFMRRGKLNDKKCKNHKQRGRKRRFKEDDDELSDSGDGSDENQKEKEDKSENASTSAVSNSTTEDEDDEVENKSVLPPGKNQPVLPHDAAVMSDTDELRRLLAETQKRLEILEQQETQKLQK